MDPRVLPVSDLVQLSGHLPPGARVTVEFTTPDWIRDLTPREREVAALVRAGLRNKQIAERLSVTLATVKDHVHHILSKSSLPSRAALAAAWPERR